MEKLGQIEIFLEILYITIANFMNELSQHFIYFFQELIIIGKLLIIRSYYTPNFLSLIVEWEVKTHFISFVCMRV